MCETEGALFLLVSRHIFPKWHSGHACRLRREEGSCGAMENGAEISLDKRIILAK